MEPSDAMCTPVNIITRDNLTVLIANNVLDNSVELASDCDVMETDSPLRKPGLQPISKKLFHSPLAKSPNEVPLKRSGVEQTRKAKKRKQILIPNSCEKIKKTYIRECNEDGYSPDVCEGIRKKMLISLFHNKEYSMDVSM